MADGDGLAPFLSVAQGELQLPADGGDLLHIIQKRNIAESATNAGVLRSIVSERGGGGAAVNEEQIAPTQNDHEVGHQWAIGGGQGALMVVDTDSIGDVLQHGADDLGNLGRGHSGVKLLRFGHFVAEGLHGQMQHDLVAAAVGFFRDLAGIRVKGEEGESERVRKGEDGVRSRAIGAEIVENDGETRSAGAGGGRRMRRGASLNRIACLGTEIPGRFGIVTSSEASKESEQ
jgi:hypothetical protein